MPGCSSRSTAQWNLLSLLGRRTYEVFAASWPQRTVEDDPFADWMNTTPKLVASTTLDTLDWQNSTVIKGNLAGELARVKQGPGRDILVNGSATLIRSLLREGLLDELHLFVHPIVLGSGTTMFDGIGARTDLTLTDAKPLSNGVLSLTYRPAAP